MKSAEISALYVMKIKPFYCWKWSAEKMDTSALFQQWFQQFFSTFSALFQHIFSTFSALTQIIFSRVRTDISHEKCWNLSTLYDKNQATYHTEYSALYVLKLRNNTSQNCWKSAEKVLTSAEKLLKFSYMCWIFLFLLAPTTVYFYIRILIG